MAIIKRLGQGVGVVVGLGQEAYAHNQAKKANVAASTLNQKGHSGASTSRLLVLDEQC